MSISIASEWRALNKTLQKQLLHNCSLGYEITIPHREVTETFDSAAWCSSVINLSLEGVLARVMSNDVRDYFGGNETPSPESQNPVKFVGTSESSYLNSMDCQDQYWCSDSSHLIGDRIVMGIFGFIICCITLVLNILLLPVFNMVGIHSSATVFLTALAVIDCMWASQCLLLTCSLYLPGTAEQQQLTYHAFQVYLVPVLWPLAQYLESLMIWIMVALLLDRIYNLRRRVDVSMLFNRSRALKITVAVSLLVACLNAPKLWRYHVIPTKNGTKIFQSLSSTYPMGHIELQMPGNRAYFIYLVVCKVLLEFLPGLVLVGLLSYLLFCVCCVSRINDRLVTGTEGTESFSQMPVRSANCSGYNISQWANLHDTSASLPSLSSALDAPRNHIPRMSTALFGHSEDYSLGPIILPSLFAFNQRRKMRHMTVQNKVRLREGLITQLAIILTVFLLLMKIPYWIREIWLLSFQQRWLHIFTTYSAASKISGNSHQPIFIYNGTLLRRLSVLVEMSSLVLIALRPIFYLTLAPHIRLTFRDMICLCFRPRTFHTIDLSGGMGAKITLSTPSRSANPSHHSSLCNTRMGSRAGSITSLSQLRRNNSTLMSLVNAYAMAVSDGQNPTALVSCCPGDLNQATKQLMLSKHSPFLADAFTQAASTYPTYPSYSSYPINACPLIPVPSSSLSSAQSGGSSSHPDSTQQRRNSLPPIESGVGLCTDTEEYIYLSRPSDLDERPPNTIELRGFNEEGK